jgi:hypothetical protein
MCKSYLNALDRQNIRFGEHFFSIIGAWEKEGKESLIHCAVKQGAKKFSERTKRNTKS